MPMPDFLTDEEMDRASSQGMPDFISDDEMEKMSAPPPAHQPSTFQRVLGAGARASDYLLGGGARGIAAIEEPIVRGLARARGVEDAPATQHMLESVESLRAKGERMQAGDATYGHELAADIPVPESGPMGHVMAATKKTVEVAGDMARDPLTWAAAGGFVKAGQGASAVARLAGAGTRAARVAEIAPAALGSAMFTVQAGKAVTPALLEAQRLYEAEGGWTPRVTEHVAEAVLMGGAAVMGGLHSIKSAGRVVEAALPDRGGEVYRADPNATREQIASLDQAEAGQEQLGQDASTRNLDALERARARLTAERAAHREVEPQPVRVGSDDASSYEQQRLAEESQPITLETKGPIVGEAQRPMGIKAPSAPEAVDDYDFLPESARKPTFEAVKGAVADFEEALKDRDSPQLGGVDDIHDAARAFAQRVPEKYRAKVEERFLDMLHVRDVGHRFIEQGQEFLDSARQQGRVPEKTFTDQKTGATVEIYSADGDPRHAIYLTNDGGRVTSVATVHGGEIASLAGGGRILGAPDFTLPSGETASGAGPVMRALKANGIKNTKTLTGGGVMNQRRAAAKGLDVSGGVYDDVSNERAGSVPLGRGAETAEGGGGSAAGLGGPEAPGVRRPLRGAGLQAEDGGQNLVGSSPPRLREPGLADVGPGIEPPQRGAQVPGVRFSPAAADVARAEGARPAPIPESRTPEGYRKLAAQRGTTETAWEGGPREAQALKARLMELWNEEQAKPEATPAGPAKRDGAPGIWEKAGRAFVRTIEPAFQAQERMPGSGRELAGRERAYVTDWEVRKGQLDAEATRALQSAGLDPRNPAKMAKDPLANQLYRYLDGLDPIESVPEAARPAAEALRGIQQKLAQEKVDRGIIKPEDVLEHHWPRKTNQPESFGLKAKAEALAVKEGIPYEKALSKLQESGSQVQSVRTSRKVTSSQERNAAAGLKEGEYRTDFGAFFDDLRESTRELAEHDHLGKNGQTALNLANQLEPGSLDHRFSIKLLDRLRGAEQQGIGHKISSVVRSVQSGIGLVASPITQFGTLGNTAAETSAAATAKAIADTFTKPVNGPDGNPMSWSRPVKRLRAALNEARLDSQAQGATNASVAEGLADYYLKTSGKGSGLSAAIGRLPHIRGTGWTDNLMRVIAAKTAPHIVPEAWKAAKSGDVTAQRALDKWHVDWRKEALTPEMLDTAARRISERSQFKVGMGDLPLWASSPWGKVAFQFQSFGYAHTQFVGGALDEARRGNVKPIAKLLTIGAGMGYLTNEGKRALFGGQAPENPTEDDFATAASAAFSKGRHYDASTARGKALAYIEGLGAAGGVGALQGVAERISSKSPAKIALGATGADVDALARAAGDAYDGKLGKSAGKFVEGVMPTLPLGLSPRAALHEALSEDPEPNPGYTGKLMDAAHARFPSIPGHTPAERQAAGELRAAGKESKRGGDALDAEFPLDKIKKPIEKRATAAKERAAKSAIVLEMARRMSRGDDAGVDAILDKAADDGHEFSERYVDNLRRRVVLHLPPELPEEEN